MEHVDVVSNAVSKPRWPETHSVPRTPIRAYTSVIALAAALSMSCPDTHAPGC